MLADKADKGLEPVLDPCRERIVAIRDDNPGKKGGHSGRKGAGAFGKILQINKDDLIMTGAGNVEKIILLNDHSIIRAQKREIELNELRIGDNIVVIGEPNENGQIEAKLIRIMPAPPPNQIPMVPDLFRKRLF